MFQVMLDDECVYVGKEKKCYDIGNIVYYMYKNDNPIPSILIKNQSDNKKEKCDIGTLQDYLEGEYHNY